MTQKVDRTFRDIRNINDASSSVRRNIAFSKEMDGDGFRSRRRDATRRDAVDIELWFAFKKDLGLLDLEQINLFSWYLTLTE